jgi:hypothetical protein
MADKEVPAADSSIRRELAVGDELLVVVQNP